MSSSARKASAGKVMQVLSVALGLTGCGGGADGNRAPVAANGNANGWEGTTLQGPLREATDADGDAVTYELVGTPSHGTALVQANGAFTYTPEPDFHGTDEFTWRVFDPQGAGNTYSMVLTVTPVNDAPRLQGAPALPPGGVVGNALVLQPDGKLVVVGNSNPDIALLRYNADGSFDASFGAGGMVTTSLGGTARGHGLILQPDGKLVVVGGNSNGGSNPAIALLRYNTDGSLDAGFGGGDGIATTPVGSGTGGYSLVLQPDGKLVVTGEVTDGGGSDIALLRYNTDGSLDTAFGGGDGIVTTPAGYYTVGYSLVLQPDGKLVVTGTAALGGLGGLALLRYNADGSLDADFGGGDGIVTTSISPYSNYDSGLSLVLQPDGKLVLMGDSCYEGMPGGDCLIALLRYNADGSLDAGFGGDDGIVFDEEAYISYRSNSLTLQPDGKLVVTRESDPYGSSSALALRRYNADGSPDTGFGGGDSIVNTTLGVSSVFCCGNRAALQPDGRLVVAGSIHHGNRSEIALLRYNADGSFDPGFGREVHELREGATFSAAPVNRIFDPDGDTLTYSATLASGAALPAWLSLNSATLAFSGTAPGGAAGQNLTIRITATDPGGLSVSDTFSFAVVP